MNEVLKEAEHAALRAKSLTQQLLTFAKGGAPTLKVASVPDLLKETAAFVLAGSKSACRFQIAPDLWQAFMDDMQISQVIENLVINAHQAMPQGGSIDVVAGNVVMDTASAVARKLQPGNYVRIAITDTGCGIRDDVLPKIFDPYFTTKEGGNGLGLAICYSIIQKHRGDISVDTGAGKTTFTLHIPASAQRFVQVEPLRSENIRGHGRVLVMDDEHFIRTLLERMLEALGYESVCTANGDEAIKTYRAALQGGQRFDAVILDLTIPGGMGGEEVIQQLIELDPTVKAIVSSGYSDGPVFASCEDYGFRGVIAKPYDITDLSRVLDTVMASASD